MGLSARRLSESDNNVDKHKRWLIIQGHKRDGVSEGSEMDRLL